MEPTIYLFFNDGHCHEAMSHYADVLGGKVLNVVRNSDAPSAADRMPGGDALVMNMSIQLGNATMMASDTPNEYYRPPAGFSISIAPASLAEFDRMYAALIDGAQSEGRPPCETFFAERFAMFTDRYGTPWMLNYAGNRMPAGG